MKITTNLGVSTEKALKHPTVCFRLSKMMTRVSDALTFGEFYLRETKGALNPQDLHRISASFFSSAKQAKDLALLVDNRELKKAIDAYSKSAVRANNTIRPHLDAKKKTLKAPSAQSLKLTAQTLRQNLSSIEKKVESLCTVEKPAALTKLPSPSAMQGRVTMAGSFKKPIYPRYFVASMGRSRT